VPQSIYYYWIPIGYHSNDSMGVGFNFLNCVNSTLDHLIGCGHTSRETIVCLHRGVSPAERSVYKCQITPSTD